MIAVILVTDEKSNVDAYLEKLKNKNSIFNDIAPLTKEYSIGQIREIWKETAIQSPLLRIYIFRNFHQSSLEAQNAFLKLMEEPPPNVQFILTTENLNLLLPTIISRGKTVYLGRKQLLASDKLTGDIEKIINSQDTGFLNQTNFTVKNKEDAMEIIYLLLSYFRKKLHEDTCSYIICKEIMLKLNLLQNNNLNPQLTLDHILIFIWKQYRMKS